MESLPPEALNITKIQTLLKAKDDTQRFVGLALLKSLLDNSEELRQDQDVIQSTWSSISSKFLDRLLKTGSAKKESREMLDLAVSVLHTFSILLADDAKGAKKVVERTPLLVEALLHSSKETTELILQVLLTSASTERGAEILLGVEDLSPLTEIASTNPLALDILNHAWLTQMNTIEDRPTFTKQVDETIQSLVSNFKGTDAVTLLEFLGSFLRQADPTLLPSSPKWLQPTGGYIQNLVTSRPTAAARSAYTNAAASLLQSYPSQMPSILFTDDVKDDKPFGYLFINLLLIDIRSSAPTLLAQLNSEQYPKTSRRLASAFDIICIFIGFLIRSLEDESMDTMIMPPDSLLKLRKGISETMSVTAEYLRDRWDASVAGAMGLHPDARTSMAEASKNALAWDSMKNNADEDPFILSAVRALALWVREEENDLLRGEASGLMDMFMDLYRGSSAEKLDFRSPILVALEAFVTMDQGRDLLLQNDGWVILTQDLASIMQNMYTQADLTPGIDIVGILISLVEQETAGTPEEWMNFITTAAAWDTTPQPSTHEFELAVLQLCCSLLAGANPGMRKRYTHSIGAIAGIASRLEDSIGRAETWKGQMDDILGTLAEVR